MNLDQAAAGKSAKIDRIVSEWSQSVRFFRPELGVRETRLVLHRSAVGETLEMLALLDDGREFRALVPFSMSVHTAATLTRLAEAAREASRKIGARLWDALVIRPEDWAPQA